MGVPEFVNLEELEGLAEGSMERTAFDYYRSGADDEISMRESREAWKRLRLVPRMLRGVSDVDTSARVLGHDLAFPVLIPPMAMQRLAHRDGERAMAKAAARHGIPMVLSTMATSSLEEVATVCPSPLLLFQIYVTRHRDITQKLIEEAVALGYKALVVTVDVPYLGNREADVRNRLSLPDDLHLKNLQGRLGVVSNLMHGDSQQGSMLTQAFSEDIDPGLTWEIVTWLKDVSKLPVLVKGLLSPEDAAIAVDRGVDGIIVSNHGGRQLDTAITSCDALPAIVARVRGRIPVLVDGGIRRGTDVVKALALGASAVLVGRPLLYALAVGGEQGVWTAIQKLKEEFKLGMGLCGTSSIQDITPSLIAPSSSRERQMSRL
ncbi:unnamed protein product [Ostreobium quekettii]|uniref:FMN hydroxy acid dehydrogenase domain-containing protein n=1 Tax=Ostreobium quekettii TaxID=121088 RepID=A0A8S1INS8_9CHLO|nr:unnamed protein product [Ostreobium quekettii]|eukprot:evm.model.scf_503.4 EVM.evm.TU.scf_503.4   scf_503:19691-24954(-)